MQLPSHSDTQKQINNMRHALNTCNNSRQHDDLTSVQMKPTLFEHSTAKSSHFFNLSDGFKKIFTRDQRDKDMKVPIAGYGGHTRGDRSQNYFGKTWRECAL